MNRQSKINAAASAPTHRAPLSATNLTVVGAGGQVVIIAPADMPPAQFVALSRNVFAGMPPSPEYLEAVRQIDEAFADMGNPLPGYEERRLHREAMQSEVRL
jgi:hypothetical protein